MHIVMVDCVMNIFARRHNKGLHQTGRGGAAGFVRRRPVIEARPAGEARCYLGKNGIRSVAQGLRSAERAILLSAMLLVGVESNAADSRSGTFVRSVDSYSHNLLTLGDDGIYEMVTMWDGPMPRIRGTYKRQGAVLTLSDPSGRVPAQLQIVDWGTRRYLVEPSRLTPLCDFLRTAVGQAPPLFPQMIFYRPMDETAAFPKKLPIVCK